MAETAKISPKRRILRGNGIRVEVCLFMRHSLKVKIRVIIALDCKRRSTL
ncbi:hypothetical protein J25TS5_42700 [Paenibacillus faecis]|nr:hypothetical protein J25TS5_42700 [Paenibacillus faecis]